MRRNTIILTLVALLALPGIALAQAFPPELDGDGAIQGELVKLIPFQHYNLPWSIPDPDPDTAWLTDIQVQILPPYDIRVEQICLLMHGDCWLPAATPITDYPWREDIGSYCHTTEVPDGDLGLDCYTWKADSWRHYTGYLDFTGHPPQFYDWGWYILDVQLLDEQRPSPYEQPTTSVTN